MKPTANASSIRNFWLLKSEPDCFSIEDLFAAPKKSTYWDGVRNYQARNFLRDSMKLKDRVLYYHSSCDVPAVMGTAVIVREGYPDHTAQDRDSDHFDPKHTADKPIWYMVDIQLDKIFDRPVPLSELRGVKALQKMVLLQKGSRLSVQPVRESEFETIVKLSQLSK
jgi:predicted RNA-binding protein with PUA-like domain